MFRFYADGIHMVTLPDLELAVWVACNWMRSGYSTKIVEVNSG